jgi:glycosyltransferase involved in cell wall biosynthesis
VDDGSSDGTGEIAQIIASTIPEVLVVRIPENGGKGAALRKAFGRTKGTLICFLDGDLDIHPEHIAPFVRILEADSVHVVIGSKRHPRSQIDYPMERRLLSRAYELLVRMLFGFKVQDTQAGIKVFRREVLENILPLGLVKQYAFDMELLVLTHRAGYRITEAPIKMRFREKYGSEVSLRAILRMFLDTLGVFYRLNVIKYYHRSGLNSTVRKVT